MRADNCRCSGRRPRCWACLRIVTFHLGSVAYVRGREWAVRVYTTVPIDQRWPPKRGKVDAIARRLIADLAAGDPQIEELLAVECHLGGRDVWIERTGQRK